MAILTVVLYFVIIAEYPKFRRVWKFAVVLCLIIIAEDPEFRTGMGVWLSYDALIVAGSSAACARQYRRVWGIYRCLIIFAYLCRIFTGQFRRVWGFAVLLCLRIIAGSSAAYRGQFRRGWGPHWFIVLHYDLNAERGEASLLYHALLSLPVSYGLGEKNFRWARVFRGDRILLHGFLSGAL